MKQMPNAASLHMIPPILFLFLAGIFVGVGGSATFEPPLLMPILNTVFASALPLLIAILALKSYTQLRSRIFVLLGCGMVAPAMASLLAGWGLAAYGRNFLVTVNNMGSLFGGACHLAAVTMLFLGSPSKITPSPVRAGLVGSAAYAATALFVASVAALCRGGLTPIFFVNGTGPTVLRQAVLTAAAICYSMSAVLLVALHSRTGMMFFSLYSNALFLSAIGLVGLLSQQNIGSPLGWTGRAAVYAGSLYFIAAVFVGRRETRHRGSSLPGYLSELLRSLVDNEVLLRTRELISLNERLRQEMAERMQVESELRRSEDRMRLAAEATGFGVYAYDFLTGRAFYSAEFMALFGLPPGADLPTDEARVPKALHPDDRPALLARMASANDPRGSGILDMEFRIAAADGKTRWLRMRGRTTFREEVGVVRPSLASGIIQDITGRKLAEEDLQKREESYRSVVESSLQGLAIVQEARIVLCNHALCGITGYSKEETYRMTREEGMALVHPQDRLRIADRLQKLGNTGESAAVERVRIFDKAGNVRWVEVLGGRTLFEGRPALQLSCLDVTDKTRAEEAYRTLVENALEGYAIMRKGRIVFANSALARISGYEPAEIEQRTVKEVSAMVHPEDQFRLRGLRGIKGADGKTSRMVQFRLQRRDGSWRTVEAQTVAVEYEGRPAMLVACHDITEPKAAQDELRSAHSKMRNLAAHLLRAREEERRKVAQEVHDDLGQILAALKMDLHWLEKRVRGISPAVDRKLKGMIDLGEQTIGVVQRISSELRPKMLDDLGLAAALEWLGADFKRRAKLPCAVRVDVPAGKIGGNAATSLYRVVQEALTNVARHSQARQASVRLAASEKEIVLEVEDDGIGITPAQSSAADSFGQIGMRERIEGLGGSLSVAGEPGRGTVVTARIPLPTEGGLA